MLSTSTSLDNALVRNHAESATLDYLAESGMEHAQWLLEQNGVCAGYSQSAEHALRGWHLQRSGDANERFPRIHHRRWRAGERPRARLTRDSHQGL